MQKSVNNRRAVCRVRMDERDRDYTTSSSSVTHIYVAFTKLPMLEAVETFSYGTEYISPSTVPRIDETDRRVPA